MSSHPYAALLVHMYGFSRKQLQIIAELLTEEDISLLKTAIKSLASKRQGERLPVIIERSYGIGCKKTTLATIGAEFDTPISAARVGVLRNNAEYLLCRIHALRPLIEKITSASIEGRWVSQTLGLPSSTPLASLNTEASVPATDSVGYFLLDCLPTCSSVDPCPTCRARRLLRSHGLEERLAALAREWQSGPSTDWRSISITTIGFSVRTRNCLINNDTLTLGQLCALSERQLYCIPNFGRKSMNEIKDVLASLGKKLSA